MQAVEAQCLDSTKDYSYISDAFRNLAQGFKPFFCPFDLNELVNVSKFFEQNEFICIPVDATIFMWGVLNICKNFL